MNRPLFPATDYSGMNTSRYDDDQLLICDIDGVILDPSGREHLAPPAELALQNENWMQHQQAINEAPDPILDMNSRIVHCVASFGKLVFLTSRLEIARDGTMRDLNKAGFLYPDVVMRGLDDHRPPSVLKAERIAAIIDVRKPTRVFFIDDDPRVIEAVRACRYPVTVHCMRLHK